MPNDEQDKAGAVAPPPLIYLGTLVFGLLLNRRFPTAFLPRTIARRLGWPLLSAGVLLVGWFEWTMRHAGTTDSPYEPVSHLLTISKLSRSVIIAGDPYRKKPQRCPRTQPKRSHFPPSGECQMSCGRS